MTAVAPEKEEKKRTLAQVIGQRIAQAREQMGYNQSDLGRALERWLGRPIPQNTISDWEKGATMPRADVLVAMAKALNTPLNRLAGIEDNQDRIGDNLHLETESTVRLMERLPETDRRDILEFVRTIYDRRNENDLKLARLGRLLEAQGGPELRRAVIDAVGLATE
jgi:transcriptional regulator with XRE-family HTH domain